MSKVERRDFLGALLGCSGVAAVSGATPLLQAGTLVQIKPDALLVLYRAGSADSEAFADVWAQTGCATQVLATDVVRQWRDDLDSRFAAGKRLLLGLGSWDDQVLLQGLAAERRRHPLLVMQHPLQAQQNDWARTHARELQSLLLGTAGAQQTQALQALAHRGTLQSATPSLFSWVLG
jgi:hypothetical protein